MVVVHCIQISLIASIVVEKVCSQSLRVDTSLLVNKSVTLVEHCQIERVPDIDISA